MYILILYSQLRIHKAILDCVLQVWVSYVCWNSYWPAIWPYSILRHQSISSFFSTAIPLFVSYNQNDLEFTASITNKVVSTILSDQYRTEYIILNSLECSLVPLMWIYTSRLSQFIVHRQINLRHPGTNRRLCQV